jgi:hypothetical protein
MGSTDSNYGQSQGSFPYSLQHIRLMSAATNAGPISGEMTY